MNKKVMILMASMMFFTTSVLPTTNQQEEASLLEYIHAADKVGELAQFADNMYIELLEKNNEELLQKKRNYDGIFKKAGRRNCALIAAYTAGSLGLLWSAMSALAGTIVVSNISIVQEIAERKHLFINPNPKALDKCYDLAASQLLKCFKQGIGGFMVGMMGFRMAEHIDQIKYRAEQDASIDALIEKNESIIAKLKEIKQAA